MIYLNNTVQPRPWLWTFKKTLTMSSRVHQMKRGTCPAESQINDSEVQISQSGEHPCGETMKWSRIESMTLEPWTKSYLFLQVPNTSCLDPGYAPQPLWSQPSWVHISEEDKVSKVVTRADLLSSVGDTVNQNCVVIQLIKLVSLEK